MINNGLFSSLVTGAEYVVPTHDVITDTFKFSFYPVAWMVLGELQLFGSLPDDTICITNNNTDLVQLPPPNNGHDHTLGTYNDTYNSLPFSVDDFVYGNGPYTVSTNFNVLDNNVIYTGKSLFSGTTSDHFHSTPLQMIITVPSNHVHRSWSDLRERSGCLQVRNDSISANIQPSFPPWLYYTPFHHDSSSGRLRRSI